MTITVFHNSEPQKTWAKWQNDNVYAADGHILLHGAADVLPMPGKCQENMAYPTIVFLTEFIVTDDIFYYKNAHADIDDNEFFNEHWTVFLSVDKDQNPSICKISERTCPDFDKLIEVFSQNEGEKIIAIDMQPEEEIVKMYTESNHAYIARKYFAGLLRLGFFPVSISNIEVKPSFYFRHNKARAWVMGINTTAHEKEIAEESDYAKWRLQLGV